MPYSKEKISEYLSELSTKYEKFALGLAAKRPFITNKIISLTHFLTKIDLSLVNKTRRSIIDTLKLPVEAGLLAYRKLISTNITETPAEIGRAPQRIDSPTPNDLFKAQIETGKEAPYKKLLHYIIAPSKKEDNGQVKRFMKNIAIQRGTSKTLEALSPDSIDGCQVRIRTIDDQFEDIPYDEIIQQASLDNCKIVISLAGVQTNQYPRALEIAAKIKAKAINEGLGHKIDVLFGGYHLRAPQGSSAEKSCQEIIDCGFTVIRGEIENGRLGQILTDVVHDKLESSYAWSELVKLEGNPLPFYTVDKKNPATSVPAVVVQLSRGCPHNCNFCAVCQVDGHKMRPRNSAEAKILFRTLSQNGITNIFIGDDNFYRNPHKYDILDAMIELKQEGINLKYMIQTDLKVVKKDKGEEVVDHEFMEKCRQAGIDMIFTGSESFDSEVLESMNKRHNLSADMKAQREAWNKHGISVTFTCILGSKYDKKGVGKRSAKTALEIGANVFIPYIYGRLPGSNDDFYFEAHPELVSIDPDLNHYDSSQATIDWKSDESLSPAEIEKEYDDLLKTFYHPKNIRKVCNSVTSLRHFVWYMFSYARARHGMSNGIWHMVFSEKNLPKDFFTNLALCIEDAKQKSLPS
ncbi:MAG: radical SAM protein [Candidatus Gracilibacteria bacterium]|nr:radical SAM protein [Candidatus Gracilibacteria bacterium]